MWLACMTLLVSLVGFSERGDLNSGDGLVNTIPVAQDPPQDTAKKKDAKQRRPARAGRARQREKNAPSGPMRIEPLAMFDNRSWTLGHETSAKLQFQVKLTGERLGQIVRAGKLYMQELVTDTGESLLRTNTYRPRDADATQAVYVTSRTLRQGYLPRAEEFKSPSRVAQKIAKARGYINVAYAPGIVEILIRNPLQFQGGILEHPKLRELGIEIEVLDVKEDDAPLDTANRGIAMNITREPDKIRDINFYDGWLRQIPARGRKKKGEDDKGYMYYQLGKGNLDEDSYLVLTVFPSIETQKIAFELDDLPLP